MPPAYKPSDDGSTFGRLWPGKAVKVVVRDNFPLHVHAAELLRWTELYSAPQFAQEGRLTLRF